MFDSASLFSVAPLEEIVINLIPVPAHPNTVFDDEAFRAAVARSVSLDAAEKVAVLKRVSELTQEQIDRLFVIFAEEAAALGALALKHGAEMQGEEEARRRRASFRALPGGRT